MERLKGIKPRGSYHKAEDAEFLPIIRRLVDQRPTYGYRPITALLNRERRAADKPVVNAKRVHRIVGNHAMLLEKHTPFARTASMTARPRSCARTCAGAPKRCGVCLLEWRGDPSRFRHRRLRPRDHRWTALANAGISGSDVRDMMLEVSATARQCSWCCRRIGSRPIPDGCVCWSPKAWGDGASDHPWPACSLSARRVCRPGTSRVDRTRHGPDGRRWRSALANPAGHPSTARHVKVPLNSPASLLNLVGDALQNPCGIANDFRSPLRNIFAGVCDHSGKFSDPSDS